MALQSFEFLPESRFNACVIEPSVIADHERFSEVMEQRQALERQWFKPGQHGCPHCIAEALEQAGEHDAKSWFYDASSGMAEELSPGQSVRFEDAIAALKRNGLFSDGEFHKKLRTTFVATARASDTSPRGRKACYRHSEEYSNLCRSREDSEHESVIRRIESAFRSDLINLYPNCQVSFKLSRKISEDVNRYPDIDYHIQGDAPQGPVDFHIAVEVQKSRISLPVWRDRDVQLKDAMGLVIWIFKQSRSGCTFKPMLTAQVESGQPAYVYAIEGEPGSSDCDLIVTPAAEGYPNFWGVTRATPTGTGNPVCQNPIYRQQRSDDQLSKPKVSAQSKVKFAGLGSLAQLLPGLVAKASSGELTKTTHNLQPGEIDKPESNAPHYGEACQFVCSRLCEIAPKTPEWARDRFAYTKEVRQDWIRLQERLDSRTINNFGRLALPEADGRNSRKTIHPKFDPAKAESDKQRIDQICQWYKQNRDGIKSLLPIEIPCRNEIRIYSHESDATVTGWIELWEAGFLKRPGADLHIYEQLYPLFKTLPKNF